MTDTTLFSNPEQQQSTQGDTTPPTSVKPEEKPAQTTDPNSVFANQLSQIKAEDGRQKYADVSTALSSIPHAQTKIQELSQQVQALQAELDKRKGVEEMAELLNQSHKPAEPTTPAPQGITEDVLLSTVEQAMARQRELEKQQANATQVRQALVEKYGEEAEKEFAKRAEELGLSVAEFSGLAYRSPKAVLAYFDVKPAAPKAQPSPQSSVNTASFGNKPPEMSAADAAIRRLTGGSTSLVDKWREAKPN